METFNFEVIEKKNEMRLDVQLASMISNAIVNE